MKIISHRANLVGSDKERENVPSAIVETISKGFDVEIDLWSKEGFFYLGHDFAQYKIEISWLESFQENLWVHAKNLEVCGILRNTNLNWFWHENDKLVLTSKGYIWGNFNVYIDGGIVVEFEYKKVPDFLYGVCTDQPLLYLSK